MKTFAERALPLVSIGLQVIPLKPRTKDAYWPGWPHMTRATPEDIVSWSADHPDDNVGAVGEERIGGMLIADVDQPEFREEIERETGIVLSDTMTVKSGRESSEGRHHYYYQTALSLELLHNPRFPGKGQVQTWHQYVVGPGSVHPATGREYELNGNPPLPIPDALVRFFAERAAKGRQRLAHVNRNDGISGTLEEKKEWIDNFLFQNGWETYSEWIPYTWPGGEPGFKKHVLCSNHRAHTQGVPTSVSCSTLMVGEGVGFDFVCQRDHCKGQLTWGDFRRMVEEVPDLSAWRKPAPCSTSFGGFSPGRSNGAK